MTAPTPIVNGATRQRTQADLYHGVPVLRLHVDDPIPSPRAPQRFAVQVHPDLARYWLTLNHPENRKSKSHAIKKYARDMSNGYWTFTPESVVFSKGGVLQNGQNRLWAITEAGVPVWLMVDFGWPDDLLQRIDRGAARTNSDALMVEGVANSAQMSGAYTITEKYLRSVGSAQRWTHFLPTSSEVLEAYREESELWDAAVAIGRRAYDSVDGLGPSTWTAAAYLIIKARDIEAAEDFFGEFIAEEGQAGSATRRLKSHYLRRKLLDTVSGDPREPLENIVRAFNAWSARRVVGFVRTGGAFELSRVKARP